MKNVEIQAAIAVDGTFLRKTAGKGWCTGKGDAVIDDGILAKGKRTVQVLTSDDFKSKAEVVSSVRDALRLYPRRVNIINVICLMAGVDDFDAACSMLGKSGLFQAGRVSFRDFYKKVSEAASECKTETKVVRMRTPKVSRAKNISIDVDAQEI